MADARQDSSKKIADKLAEIQRLLNEAQQIADENGVSFSWGGPAYGMGGSYHPKEDWNDSGCSENDWNDSGCSGDDGEYGWMPSSQSCS